MQDFRKLAVWRKAHLLAVEVYRASAGFPVSERFGLTNQMRRAAVSIAANIAEGCGRDSDPDMKRFLQIAMGSASELHSQLLLALDLGFIHPDRTKQAEAQLEEVKRMLSALIVRIRGLGKAVSCKL
ncbi:MAG: four helix bundle protein [Acidobacteria bacterium]|nr:MAG: four helix bundle protein [Acidobacteriota bacterium]